MDQGRWLSFSLTRAKVDMHHRFATLEDRIQLYGVKERHRAIEFVVQGQSDDAWRRCLAVNAPHGRDVGIGIRDRRRAGVVLVRDEEMPELKQCH